MLTGARHSGTLPTWSPLLQLKLSLAIAPSESHDLLRTCIVSFLVTPQWTRGIGERAVRSELELEVRWSGTSNSTRIAMHTASYDLRRTMLTEKTACLDDSLENGYGTFTREVDVSVRAPRPPLAEDWMGLLDDNTLVSALSIPGTHDSAAFTHPWPFIATQKMNISEQLHAGVRYFDLRCGIRDDITEMVHGPSILDLRLYKVLATMYEFLGRHPTEGLIVQIKEDRAPERSTMHFSQAIFQHIGSKSERWRTASTTPILAELRGKIQLFRRYNGPSVSAYGINVTNWQDNPSTPFTIHTLHEVELTIQDHYNFSDPTSLPDLISIKGGDVSGLLNRASKDTNDCHWYLNFTSASEFNFWYQLSPREIAIGGYSMFRWEDGMNPRLRNYLRLNGGPQRFGIIAMDFPESGADDLIETLIKSNFKTRAPMWPALLYIALLSTWITLVLLREFEVLKR